MPLDDGTCCAQVIKATADIAAIESEMDDIREDVQRWRQQHEHREEGQFNLMMNQLVAIQAEQSEMRKMLVARLPVWATLLLTGAGATVGMLLGIIWELGRIVRGG